MPPRSSKSHGVTAKQSKRTERSPGYTVHRLVHTHTQWNTTHPLPLTVSWMNTEDTTPTQVRAAYGAISVIGAI